MFGRKNRVNVGDKAPDFTLPNQDGVPIRLSDFIGKKIVVLFFYPKDDSPGCRVEACAFRDTYIDFKDAGAEVIGISSDPVESHKRFASKYKLPYHILSDKGGRVRKLYGVPSTLGIIPGRVTYIIDKQGYVRHIFSSQFNPRKHVEEALKIVERLQQI